VQLVETADDESPGHPRLPGELSGGRQPLARPQPAAADRLPLRALDLYPQRLPAGAIERDEHLRAQTGPLDGHKLDLPPDHTRQLLGRITYQGFAAAWPAVEETTGEFGAKMNAMPKVVVSTTLAEPSWKNTTVTRGDACPGCHPGLEQDGADGRPFPTTRRCATR
jgi:hypothetical protein